MCLSCPPVESPQSPPGSFCILPLSTVSARMSLKIMHSWNWCFRHRQFIKSPCKLCNQTDDWLSWELDTLKGKVPIVLILILLPYQILSFHCLSCVIGTCCGQIAVWINGNEDSQSLGWNEMSSSVGVLRSFDGILWLMTCCFPARCFSSHCKTSPSPS